MSFYKQSSTEKEKRRYILHLDLDAFFVSVEYLINPSLKGKPVIIGGTGDRGVVSSCSYEARAYGVTSAMPFRTARRLCPDGIYLPGRMGVYGKYSQQVTDIIAAKAPVYEKSSIDEFYVDLTGMDTFFDCYQWATGLRETIREETGLPISFGLSSSKIVSKIATGEAKPDGQRWVKHGEEKEFLAPLDIYKIPMVGEKACQLLRKSGIHTIGDLQEAPVGFLKKHFGEHGISMWMRAHGIDASTVDPHRDQKSMSTERTFEKDTRNIKGLKNLLIGMTEELCSDLRKLQKLTAGVAVKVRYENFETHTHQRAIPCTSCDHHIIPVIKELFDEVYQPGRPVRLIGVKLGSIREGNYQAGLFEDVPEWLSLYQALDKINRKFEGVSVKRAVGMARKTDAVSTFLTHRKT